MSRIDPLSSVIRCVEPGIKPIAQSESSVVVDLDALNVVQKRGWFGNYANYIVNSGLTAAAECEGPSIVVKGRTSSFDMSFSLIYRVNAEPGGEQKLALALCKEKSPGFALNKQIEAWVLELIQGRETALTLADGQGEKFIATFQAELQRIEQELKYQASQIGLNLQSVKFLLQRSLIEYIADNTIGNCELAAQENLAVSIQNISSQQDIKLSVTYKANFHISDRQKVVAAFKHDSAIAATLNQKIKDWIEQEIRDRTSTFISPYAYPTERLELQNNLKLKARDEVGLHLDIAVSLVPHPVAYLKQTDDITGRSKLVFPIEDLKTGRRINLVLEYRAGFEPQNSHRVAHAFPMDQPLPEAISAKVRGWIDQLVQNSQTGLLSRYQTEIERLKQSLEEQALREAGLRLHGLRFALEGQDDLRPFAVGSAQAPISLPVRVKGFDRELSISIYTELLVDDDQRAIALMHSPTTQQSSVVSRFYDEIKRYTAQQVTAESLYNNLSTEVKPRLMAHLNQMLRAYGRRIEFLLIEPQIQLSSVKIGSDRVRVSLPVVVQGCDEEISLSLYTELLVDETNILPALQHHLQPNYPTLLQKVVEAEIKRYLWERVSIVDFCQELKGNVRTRLMDALDSVLRPYGRKIGHLFLDSNVDTLLPKELLETQCLIQCSVNGYSEPIQIENKVQLLLQDRTRFWQTFSSASASGQSRQARLQTWVTTELEKITKPLLLNSEYIDVLTQFSEIEKTIKARMVESARTAGFTVEQIVSVPNLKHNWLKRSFSLEEKEGNYTTNNANVEVKLNTNVTVSIEDFQKIKAYLNPHDNIQEIVLEAIQDAIRECLHDIDPERYYMRFDRQGDGESLSVEQELKDRITVTLKERFGAEVKRVFPKRLSTWIEQPFNDLLGKRDCSLEFEILPLGGGEAVKFTGLFRVIGVQKASWYQFQSFMGTLQQSRQFSLDELQQLREQYASLVHSDAIQNSSKLKALAKQISESEEKAVGIDLIRHSIIETIKQKFSLQDVEVLKYLDYQNLDRMQQAVNRWANHELVEQYGLGVRIFSLQRSRTETERAIHESDMDPIRQLGEDRRALQHNRTEKLKDLTERISKLRASRAELIGRSNPEDFADEIENFDIRIRQYEQDLSALADETHKAVRTKTSNAKKVSFIDPVDPSQTIAGKSDPLLQEVDEDVIVAEIDEQSEQ
jgi:hypothetical protein